MAKILVVDDRSINQEYLCTLLEYFGHKVSAVEDGIEALKCLPVFLPDLIITDILMPKMDGYEFIRELIASPYRSIPVIIYSASLHEEAAQRLSIKMNIHVLTKPCEPHVIVDTVSQVLGVIERSDFKISEYAGGESSFMKDFKSIVGGLTTSELVLMHEMYLNMMVETDRKPFFNLFCKGASEFFLADFMLVGLVNDENRFLFFCFDGIEKSFVVNEEAGEGIENIFQIASELQAPQFCDEVLISLLSFFKKKPLSSLIAPFGTKDKKYGFCMLMHTKKASAFSEHHLKSLNVLVSKASLLYEKMDLYQSLQRKAARLQIESMHLKKAKKEIAKSEMMFRQFAENIKEVFWRINFRLGVFEYVSPGYKEIWGYDAEELYKNPQAWQAAVIEEDRAKIKDLMQALRENKVFHLQFRIQDHLGRLHYIYNKIFPLRNALGKIDTLIGIASDVTAWHFQQKKVEVENSLYAILESSATLKTASKKFIQNMCILFSWIGGELWIIDEEKEALALFSIWAQKGKQNALSKANVKKVNLNRGEGIAGKVWERKGLYQTKGNEVVSKEGTSAFWGQDSVGFPLHYKEEIQGVLIFYASSIVSMGEQYEQLFLKVGNRLGEFLSQKKTNEHWLRFAMQGGGLNHIF